MSQAVETVLDRDPVGHSVGFARLTRDSVLYALGSVAGKVIGLMMLPIVTRLMSPAEFGRLDLLSTVGSAIISVSWLGIDLAVIRLLAGKRATASARQIGGSFVTVLTVISMPWIVGLVALGPGIGRWLLRSETPEIALALVAWIVASGTAQIATMTLLRARERTVAYSVVLLTSLVFNALIGVGLLVLWRPSAEAMLTAIALGQSIGALVGLALLGRRTFGLPSRDVSRSLLIIGLPFAPAVFASWGAELANRAILVNRVDVAELGFLSVALRMSSLVGLIVAGFQLAWLPRAFALGDNESARRLIGIQGRRIVALVSLSVGAFAAISYEVVTLVSGEAFAPAVPVVGPLLVAGLGTALFLVLSMPSALARRTGDIGLAGTVGAALSVTANLALATTGSIGTAIAIALGQWVGALLLAWLGRRRPGLGIPWGRVAPLVAATIGAVLLCTMTSGTGLTTRLLILSALLAVALWEGTLMAAYNAGRSEWRRRRGS